MKNKGVLLLVELTVMLSVFALASVLCLRAFLWSDTASKELADRDQAMLCAQNAAEVLKSCSGDGERAARLYGGTWDGTVWRIHYDADWAVSDTPSDYLLTSTPADDSRDYLGMASIRVTRTSGAVLWEHQIAWQEVFPDE